MSDKYLMPEAERDKLWERVLDLTDCDRGIRHIGTLTSVYMDVNAMINTATMRAYEMGKAAALPPTPESEAAE